MTHKRLPEDLEYVPLPACGGRPASHHVFERRSILAINTALACRRPLLIRGEPGVGKSQLARAAAAQLGRVFLSVFVHARTEAHELLWSHDAVTRLADAQAFAHGPGKDGKESSGELLDQRRYIRPGPLWWALSWGSANTHSEADLAVKALPPVLPEGWEPAMGAVLLIDEIDKADSSVPNGLLECLGQGTFAVPGFDAPISAKGTSPLVVLTTNEDRSLPDAFVRRCVVLHLRLPDPKQWKLPAGTEDFETWLVTRGKAHQFANLDESTLREAANQLISDRRKIRNEGHCPPGLAEYIDLLAALDSGVTTQLKDIAEFVFHKHADPMPRSDGR